MPGKRLTIKCVKLIIGHSLVGRLGDQTQALYLVQRFVSVLRLMVSTKCRDRFKHERLPRLEQPINRALQ